MKCVMRAADGRRSDNNVPVAGGGWFRAATLLTSLLLSGQCLAELPQLMVQVREGQSAGRMADGRLLATGTVVHAGVHNGFRVWSDALINGSPQRVTLTGLRDSSHRMNVRLSGKDWQPDTEKGRGIVLRTDSQSATFSVEVDGAQDLPVDTWPLQLRAVVLLP
ncbi:TPA: pilin structural protein SafD [Enterobacter cloacae]|nr:pilin structural protein SafD [Enterobacter cloacae]